jgi:hypothetical protein
MVNRNLLRQFELSEDDLRQELDAAFDQGGDDWLPPEEQSFRDHRIVTGRVRKVTGDAVWVDVGYKSEGAIELREWYDEGTGQIVPPRPGDRIAAFRFTWPASFRRVPEVVSPITKKSSACQPSHSVWNATSTIVQSTRIGGLARTSSRASQCALTCCSKPAHRRDLQVALLVLRQQRHVGIPANRLPCKTARRASEARTRVRPRLTRAAASPACGPDGKCRVNRSHTAITRSAAAMPPRCVDPRCPSVKSRRETQARSNCCFKDAKDGLATGVPSVRR